MPHVMTRREMSAEIEALIGTRAKLERELELLRNEVGFHQAEELRQRQVREQLWADRDRLTATIEVLARRIASDRGADFYTEGKATDPTSLFKRFR